MATLVLFLVSVADFTWGWMSINVFQSIEFGVFFLCLGIGFAIMGWASMFFIFCPDEWASLKKAFRRNRRGAIWIWAVCLLALVVLAMGWFTLTWPTYMIINYIESVYTFPPEAQPAVTLMKNVIAWFLIFMALGLLLWAYVASQRREEISYPM